MLEEEEDARRCGKMIVMVKIWHGASFTVVWWFRNSLSTDLFFAYRSLCQESDSKTADWVTNNLIITKRRFCLKNDVYRRNVVILSNNIVYLLKKGQIVIMVSFNLNEFSNKFERSSTKIAIRKMLYSSVSLLHWCSSQWWHLD